MTNQEATETLHTIRLALTGNPNIVDEEYARYDEAIDKAIKALEKQVPKKPKLYEDKYYMCDCGECLAYKYEADGGLPFCLGCGQAIDWSDEK